MTTVPPPPENVEELAEWYTCNLAGIQAIERAKGRLRGYVDDQGPQRTAHGVVAIRSAGNIYDWSAIAAVMPGLVKACRFEITVHGEGEAAATDVAMRLYDLVREQVPSAEVEMHEVGDGMLALRTLNQGGEAGAKLAPHVSKKKGPLEVRSGDGR